MNDDKLKYDVEYRKSNESLVKEYFKTIRSKDLHRLLKLFSDDSVIHQPFSSSKYLSGKTEIEPFFRTVIMAIEEAQ